MSEVLAAIDVGTNSVLLTVARLDAGKLTPLVERAEITRLGKGVDRTGLLAEPGMTLTSRVLGAYVEEALGWGVKLPAAIACVATSAARDAKNGAAFLERVKNETGLTLEIIDGDREATLMYRAAWHDFGAAGTALAVVDLGGGSTEVAIALETPAAFVHSFPVGAVRLHERWEGNRSAIEADIDQAFARFPKVEAGTRAVGVAGTWTTLAALSLGLAAYDATQVHGRVLAVEVVEALAARLWSLSLPERLQLPGLQPGRADVIPTGALIAARSLRALGADHVTISDRGVRWGLLYAQLGSPSVGGAA